MSKHYVFTALPVKSDSDVMSCLQVIRDLESIDHLCINPIRRIGLIHSDISIPVSSCEVYTLVFYLAIVNKVLRHCHSWLARQ